MAHTVELDANTARLFAVLKPYLLKLLRDAPQYGEISLTASLHGGDIGKVQLGTIVARKVSPHADRGE